MNYCFHRGLSSNAIVSLPEGLFAKPTRLLYLYVNGKYLCQNIHISSLLIRLNFLSFPFKHSLSSPNYGCSEANTLIVKSWEVIKRAGISWLTKRSATGWARRMHIFRSLCIWMVKDLTTYRFFRQIVWAMQIAEDVRTYCRNVKTSRSKFLAWMVSIFS